MPPPINPPNNNSSILGNVLGAVPLVGGVLSAASQIFTNNSNKRWQEKMYDRQRAHALADWTMQNEYNSPANQMARLKSAGLNPNLVYGTGAVANNAQGPRSSSPGSFAGRAPELSGSGAVDSLMLPIDMAIKKQQLDNLRVSNAAMMSGILNKNADTALKAQNTASGQFKLSLEQSLSETTIATREAFLRNLGIRNELGTSQTGMNLLSLDLKQKFGADTAMANLENMRQLNVLRDAANARAESTNLWDLKIKAQQVINMFSQNAKTMAETANLQHVREGIKKANTLKDLDIFLKQVGFNWNDPYLIRQLRFQFPNR